MNVKQLVSFLSLIWQHVMTSEGHLQAYSIKYIKGIARICMKFCTEISIVPFD